MYLSLILNVCPKLHCVMFEKSIKEVCWGGGIYSWPRNRLVIVSFTFFLITQMQGEQKTHKTIVDSSFCILNIIKRDDIFSVFRENSPPPAFFSWKHFISLFSRGLFFLKKNQLTQSKYFLVTFYAPRSVTRSAYSNRIFSELHR